MSWRYKIASSWPRTFCRDRLTWVQTIWHHLCKGNHLDWKNVAFAWYQYLCHVLFFVDSWFMHHQRLFSQGSCENAHLPFTRGTSGCNRAANKRCTSVALSKHRPISSTAFILNYSLPKCQKQMTFWQDLPSTLASIFPYDLIPKKGHVKPLDHLRSTKKLCGVTSRHKWVLSFSKLPFQA